MVSKHKNLLIILLLLAMVLFYVFSGGSVGISLDFGEDSLSVSASDYDWTIPYDHIESLELAGLPDLGIQMEGIERNKLSCGTWKNDAWGEYTLCVNPKNHQCIVVVMDDGDIFVLNYENSDSTEQLHKMFTELLCSKGFLTADQKP